MNLQPLRVISGWTIEWNTFMEVDPDPNDMSAFSGSSLLHAYNEHAKRAINLEWKPEEDPNGEFHIRVINLYEEYNSNTKKIDLVGVWETPHFEFYTKERSEAVFEIERLMLQLNPYEDPRIMKSPGIVDEEAESIRLKLEEELDDSIANQIFGIENKVLQNLLVDHKEVRKTDLIHLSDSGVTKGIRNKALQKLNSKAFRNI